MISGLIQIEALDWFVITLLAGIEFFAWYVSAALDGPDAGMVQTKPHEYANKISRVRLTVAL